eukprot:CAMPEP_0204829138 /NCGR_PEP_ID=MMETSP1346-20131115/7185_1 /ASSEMBLY_ACC=CAM_ASM_000771 /TAXON_ID=215587 /ORGANISM="Aplanochytrium stocchinoi, Strain GSBS06" /LENGTH=197 /DNA_ID=CAMNT_0051958691 /DNA_START=123 /DNA_END=716 /DNA_ORIENTATION=+
MELSEAGLKQAELLAKRLSGPEFRIRKIISSDLARAKQTAEAVAKLLNMAVHEDSLLQERNFGHLRGQSYDSLMAKGINILQDGYEPPGGDSMKDFASRCDLAWEKIRAEASLLSENDHLCVVTHGLVLQHFISKVAAEEAKAGNLNEEKPRDLFAIQNTAVTVVKVGEVYSFHKDIVNCAAHLEEIDLLGKKRLYL